MSNTGVKNEKSKARKLVSQHRKLQKELNEGTPLNVAEKNDLINQQIYPATYGSVGQWMESSKKDEDMKIRRELIDDLARNPNAVTPYGQVTAGPEVVDYIKEKKAQEQYFLNTKLAAYLVVPKRPETQERAYLVAPQLKEIPEQQHERDIAIQEALRVMLRDGIIRGPEDHALITEICKWDYVLPAYPLWDPTGDIINQLNGFDKQVFYNVAKERSIFNPVRYGISFFPGTDAQARAQAVVKAMILKRLYPGLREKSIQYITNNFIAPNSPINDQLVSNDATALTRRLLP